MDVQFLRNQITVLSTRVESLRRRVEALEQGQAARIQETPEVDRTHREAPLVSELPDPTETSPEQAPEPVVRMPRAALLESRFAGPTDAFSERALETVAGESASQISLPPAGDAAESPPPHLPPAEEIASREALPSEAEESQRFPEEPAPESGRPPENVIQEPYSPWEVPTPSPEVPFWANVERQFVEHWVGILGSVILVTGVGFVGVYGALLVSPFLRFLILTGLAALLGGVALTLTRHAGWKRFANWLGSASAAIFLFSCLGSGGIPALQWVEDPSFALLLLAAGIAVNFGFVYLTADSAFASLHSVLSLVALGFAPPYTLTLALATLVVMASVAWAHRYRWDLHLLIVLGSYLGYLVFFRFQAEAPTEWMQVGKLAVSAVGLEAALVHYRKDYATPVFEPLPGMVHLFNWLMVGSGLGMFATGSRWQAPLAFGAAVALYFLARKGRSIGVRWVYLGDMLIAQLFALIGFFLLARLEIDGFFLCAGAFFETVVFCLLMKREERALETASYVAVSLGGFFLALMAFSRRSLGDNIPEDLALLGTAAAATLAVAWPKRLRSSPWHFPLFASLAEGFALLLLLSTWRLGLSAWIIGSAIAIEALLFLWLMTRSEVATIEIAAKYLLHFATLIWLGLGVHPTTLALPPGVYFAGFGSVLGLGLVFGCIFQKKRGDGFDGFDLYGIPWLDRTSVYLFLLGLTPALSGCAFFAGGFYHWAWEGIAASLLGALIVLRQRIQSSGLGLGLLLSMTTLSVLSITSLQDLLDRGAISHAQALLKVAPMIAVYILALFQSSVRELGRSVKWPPLYLLTFTLIAASYLIARGIAPAVSGVVWLCLSLAYLELARAGAKRSTPASGDLSRHLLSCALGFVSLFLISHLLQNLQLESYLGPIRARLTIEGFALGVFLWWLLSDWPAEATPPWAWERFQPLFLELLLAFAVLTAALEVERVFHPACWMLLSIGTLIAGAKNIRGLGRLAFYSLLFAWAAILHVAVITSTWVTPSAAWHHQPWVIGVAVILVQLIYLVVFVRGKYLAGLSFPAGTGVFRGWAEAVAAQPSPWVYYPFFAAVAVFLYWRFDRAVLTLLWVTEIFGIFSLSIFYRENHFRILALSALALCLVRLVFFDMGQTAALARGFVFLGVGGLMLLMNALYTKFGRGFDR